MCAVFGTYNEHDLLEDLKRGKSDAFLELYNRYHHPLYRFVLRFVKAPALAEDILQDVFLKIWEGRKRINPELSFKAYLYRISRNSVFKLMKKIAADESLRNHVMRQLHLNEENADVELLSQEYKELYYLTVSQLPPQRQKVFRLCREQGKTYDQAAAELGISRNTVKEHMVMSMKFIKERFRYYDMPLAFLMILFCI
jgi:RNA polymerase sigma-70 factor (family 1)